VVRRCVDDLTKSKIRRANPRLSGAGFYGDFADEGIVIREETDGFRFLLDLQKHDKAVAISKVEELLARLKK
jgi:hypothetical protein